MKTKAHLIVLVSLAALLLFVSCASTADIARAAATAEGIDPAHPFAESAFVSSAGVSVHYRHWAPTGTPVGRVFLLHGFGSSTFTWRFLVPELLDAGWEVAAADIPPFGYSDKSDAIARQGYDRGSQLWVVPDALGWTGPIVLVGHSMGGLFAAAMAEREPTRVGALVFLAGAVPVDGKGEGGPPFFAGLFTGFLESSLHSWSGVKSNLKGFAGKEELPDAMVDGYAAPFQLPGGVKALLAWSGASGKQAPVHPASLGMPALLVWGEKDSAVPLTVGEKLAAAIVGSTLVVLPGLGHLVHELHPELVDPLILDFLRRLPVATTSASPNPAGGGSP
jgi:pimeloyl-ACP methyl ester carboxylesterase